MLGFFCLCQVNFTSVSYRAALINLPRNHETKYPNHNPPQMIRSELVSNLAIKHPQFTASDVELAVKTIMDSLVNRLAQGDRVELRGFGSFSSYTRPPRLGRNPRTGEIVPVPEKRVLYFRQGTELRERVNVEQVEQRDVLKKIA
jgi:integration host factor subunit beta